MKILVTGGQGRLGQAVTTALIERGDQVVSLDRRLPAIRQPNIRARIADITDAGQMLDAMRGCEAVIHCAAIPSPEAHPPETIFASNVAGTFAVLQAAKLSGIRRAVVASSLSALGGAWADPPHPPRYVPVDESHPLEVEDPYGLSKIANELTAEMFHRQTGMTIAALRFGWILSASEAAREAEAFAADPERNSAGLWSYIDERDAAAACICAVDASDYGYAVMNIIGHDTIATMPTSEAIARYAPEVEVRSEIPGFASPFRIERARELIGYEPKHSWRDDQLTIEVVTFETRHHFSELLEAARVWQASLGAEGWDYPFDDEWMLPRIARNELFLARIGNEPIGAFRILWEDIPFWGDRETGESIYLHTFTVRRDRAGSGLGSAIIERVAEMGRARGRKNIRLDCALSSTNLIAFYERNGFVSSGTIFLGGRMMNLMERAI
jgi:nucleoside-diphosphate-sugar epimerase/GNAT superfamily N-acetyltransferase